MLPSESGPVIRSRLMRPSKLLAIAAAAAIGAGAFAQDAAITRARPRPPLAPTLPSAPVPGTEELSLRGTTATQPPGTRPNLRRGPTRRSRPPTTLAARQVRVPTLAPRTARDVQLPVTGLPDPAVLVVSRRRPRVVETDPYASLGIRSGGLTYFPAVEQSVGYDSNPNRLSGTPQGSFVSRTEGALRVQSDWPVHALNVQVRGAYNAFLKVPDANRPDANGRASLRFDLTRDTQIDLVSAFRIDTERPRSPELGVSVVERPLNARFGAAAGVTERFNRLSVGLRGSIDRAVFEDARLTSGEVLDQTDRNVTVYGARLRTGYEFLPGTTPFVDLLVDTRIHDRRIDNAGFRRDSEGYGFRADSTFEITRLITGEAAAGYEVRRFEDERLRELRGPILDAAVIWAVTPLTTLRLRASAQTDDTTVTNASGILSQRAVVELHHDLRRNLSLIGALTFSRAEYQGIFLREDGFAASLRLDYRLTRALALRASYTHESLKSTSPGSNYKADVFLVGMRIQP